MSVHLSVPYLTLSQEWKGISSWKLAGRKPWHVWPMTPFRGQKIKGQCNKVTSYNRFSFEARATGNNNNDNNTRTIFIVLSSWPQAIARVHSVHLMNCRTAYKRPSTLKPSHLTWAVSPPVGSYRLQPPSPFIIITQPEKLILIYRSYGVEGWVDLGTAGKVL